MSQTVYEKLFEVSATAVDCFDRLQLSRLLACIQEAAGDHSALLVGPWQSLMARRLMWAVIRHRVEITRLPSSGEAVTVQTWPMPTTRTAFPRATVAMDSSGKELFRAISLWVLMDPETRAMVLPGNSGLTVNGWVRGGELAMPSAMLSKNMQNVQQRPVRFTDLDVNGHMNNCRYMDWVQDLLPAQFHGSHTPKEFVVCYSAEAREQELLELHWTLQAQSSLQVQAQRPADQGGGRVFSARIEF